MLLYRYMKEKMQAKTTNIVWFQYFFLFFTGLFFVYGIRVAYIQLSPQSTFSPSLSSLTLAPPTQSLQGKITDLQGIVEKKGRDDSEFKKVQDMTIVQGDSLATQQGKAQIFLGNQTAMTLFPNTEIGFVNLMPETLFFKQVSGITFYNLTARFSVRALHSLIETSNPLTVTVNKSQITIIPKIGPAKIGLVDLENNTHVYTVSPGETAQINDETRSVKIN